VGCWWYRYTLKRDPAKLERLAAEADKLKAKLPPELVELINQMQVKIRDLEAKK
jgi:hypothetical protein